VVDVAGGAVAVGQHPGAENHAESGQTTQDVGARALLKRCASPPTSPTSCAAAPPTGMDALLTAIEPTADPHLAAFSQVRGVN